MRTIRRGVFETNSSSTHSICITSSDSDIEKPKFIRFRLGEFGWSEEKYYDAGSKASYLYTGICDFYYGQEEEIAKCLTKIEDYLDKNGVECEFISKNDESDFPYGYIDHSDDLGDFLEGVLKSDRTLMRYLFSPQSFILTGNDNWDSDVDINVDYPHEEYYKGN